MKTFKTLLIPAILLFAGVAAACDSYSCYSSSYCDSSYCSDSYYGSYSYSGYSAPFQSCSYSNWTYDQSRGYSYCVCSFRPSAYAGYSKYICIYNAPSKSVYYYNPVTKAYWGRYDEAAKGFSVLPAAEQRGTIAELPQDKFPAPASQAVIPGSQVNEQLAAPPALAAQPADAVPALPAT